MDEYLLIICTILLIFFVSILIMIRKASSPNALYEGALDEFDQGEYRIAFKYLKKALQIKPADIRYLQLLGLTSLKLHDYNTAENCFNEILKVEPDRLEAVYNLALTYQMAEKLEDAKTYYYKALSINDKDKDTLYNLGLLLYEMGEYKDAVSSLEKASKLDPEKSILQFYIAKCKDKISDSSPTSSPEEIISMYSKLEGKAGLPIEYNITLATAFAKAGNIQKAQEYCSKAILSVEDDIQNYKLQGLLCLVRKDFDCAKNNLQIATQLNPNDEEVYNLLKYV